MPEYILDRFAAALARAAAQVDFLAVQMRWQTAICVIASLQLALRHPAMPSATRSTVREAVDTIISHIESVDADLAVLMRMGDDPTLDTRG